MRTHRACYSYSALYRCAEAVKATTWTVRRSAEHFSKCFEIKKIFELCYEETHCLLFEPDFSPWYDYLKAVDRKETKKGSRLQAPHLPPLCLQSAQRNPD